MRALIAHDSLRRLAKRQYHWHQETNTICQTHTKKNNLRNLKVNDIIKQYETFALRDGIVFDAFLGVGEDMADISGMSLAEEYLLLFQEKNEDIDIIKEISLNAFFTYIAIQSRQKIQNKALTAQLKINPHPLEKYRCNCPLTRLSLFNSMYNIKKGDGMWWHNKDAIW